MIKLFAVLQTFSAILSDRLREKVDNPETGMESLQVVIIAAVGLAIVLGVLAAIRGRVNEWISQI